MLSSDIYTPTTRTPVNNPPLTELTRYIATTGAVPPKSAAQVLYERATPVRLTEVEISPLAP
jgi:hypothetical protein